MSSNSPPAYTNPVDPKLDPKHHRLPPYRAKHSFANSAEELAALNEFAESKLYVNPGSDGTLPDLQNGGWGLKSLAWGGPMQGEVPGDRGWPAPETAEERKRRREAEKARKKEERASKGKGKGGVGERLKRVISGGSVKEGGR
ncbi:hypothetical protein A1O7_07365 [Cladophialophora yegresii CBS 114405]|uniref:Uncharacterized protein n=1 Tax=Cladophialophora yegresii CBS 114405 TaxID=1182544 RepID=W9VXR6_9EURO|nr:uncharacterized protein A1O7_07365 [Cladophialophora yegresii CBS 114405]EXJ57021.1 hypothetical protein A1O7_07365 [Cladophialophora yegresii CBS 114405]